MKVTDAEFAAAQMFLTRVSGLVFDESRRAGLSRVLVERAEATGHADAASYLALVAAPSGAAELRVLLDTVTVQETQFFRNPPQLEALRQRVLPELVRRAVGRHRPLTVWSAGCSTGEEPYTLAMMLLDLSPAGATAPGTRVVGTDVSARALDVAERATYQGRSVSGVPAAVREQWFEPGPGGALTVGEEPRKIVELSRHNLVTDPPPFGRGEVDLVVCRNVTIYFSRDTTRELVARFHGVLAEGGYLLLGHAETLWQVSTDFTLVPVGDAFVYRKAPAGPAGPAGQAGTGRTDVRPSAATAPRPRRGSRHPAAARPRALEAAGLRRAARPGAQASAASATTPTAPGAAGSPRLLAVARQALAAGDYHRAARTAAGAVDADPLRSDGYLLLGQARATLGQDLDALDPLRKAVYLDPAAGHAHFLLAGCLARAGQVAQAAVSYRAAARSLPSVPAPVLATFLDGRDVAELVDLCDRLAELCTTASVEEAARAAGASAQ